MKVKSAMEHARILTEICSEVRERICAADVEIPEADFNSLARRIFALQFEANLPYQRFCKRVGRAPESSRDYREIPAMVTSAFKELELTVLAPEERTKVFYSSGTIGEERSRHFHNAISLAVYEQSLLAAFKPSVLPDLGKADFLMLTPSPEDAPNSSLVHMLETVALEFAAEASVAERPSRDSQTRPASFFADTGESGTWEINYSSLKDFPARIAGRNLPVVICGTAFSFVHFCDHLASEKQTLRFPEGSRVFETGGYKGRSRIVTKEELHGMIERYLGIPQTHIISEYGMSELSSQAYDRRVGEDGPRLFRFPPWVRWEIISPENGKPMGEGETGLLRVWDLANVASVLAIQTEDLATRRNDGFVLAGRAVAAQARGCSLMNV